MLTVIVILGILLAMAAPYVIGDLHRSQDTQTKRVLALAFEQVKKQAEATTPADCSPYAPPCVYPTDTTRQALQTTFPTVRFNDGLPSQAAAQIGQIGVETDSQNEAVLCVKSDSGNFFSIRYVSNGANAGAYYGAGDSCTDGVDPATPGIPYDTGSGPNPTPAAQGTNECTNDEWSCGSGSPASGGGGGSGGSDVADPVNLTPPVISGDPGNSPGAALSASTGTWDPGYPPVSYTYQWSRDGAAISGATSNTYVTTASDMNTNLTVQVTATTASGGETTVSSDPFLVADAPSGATGSDAPLISGSAKDGATLSAAPGTWDGTPPLVYAYQWQTSTNGTSGWMDIAGATSLSYTIASTLIGDYLRIAVTATNAAGSATAESAATAQVTAASPSNASAPTVTDRNGSPLYQGDVLDAAHGTWSGTTPITYGYQWQRCDSSGANCAAIGGATSASYTTVNTDIGSTIVVSVTATGPGGSGNASSSATAVVQAAPPANGGDAALPTIFGSPVEGALLTSSTGTWAGTTPINYAYQWQRCDETGSSCATIGGASASTYTTVAADLGHELRLVVTGTNGGGSSQATSDATALIGAAAPANSVLPTLGYPDGYSPPRDGDRIQTSNGTWTGTTPLAYIYSWQRCDSSGANCVAIAGAGSSQMLGNGGCESGTGSWTTANATATQAASPVAAGSASCQLVASGSGTFGMHQSAAVSGATAGRVWDGAAAVYATGSTVGKTFQLRLAEEGGAGGAASTSATATLQAGWNVLTVSRTFANNDRTAAHLYVEILGGAVNDKVWVDDGYLSEDGSTYTLTSSDIGSTIRAVVSAMNAAGSSSASSSQSQTIAARPVSNLVAPVATDANGGSLMVGDSADSTDGSWSGSPTITFTYQWQRSPDGASSWTDLSGATSSGYTPVSADIDYYLRDCVIAHNSATPPSGTSCSNAIGPVVDIPRNVSAPVLSGSAIYGSTLSTTNGTWTGSTPINYGYQWQRADDAAFTSNVSSIAGATASTYAIQSADVGEYLRSCVTATNSAGFATACSSASALVTSATPVGTVAAYVGSSIPSGWALANGACGYTSTANPKLWAAIGATYGGSSSNFCLPDLRGRMVLGKAASGTGSTLGSAGGALDQSGNVNPWGTKTLSFSWSETPTAPAPVSHTHGNDHDPFQANYWAASWVTFVSSDVSLDAANESFSTSTINLSASGSVTPSASYTISNPPYRVVRYLIAVDDVLPLCGVLWGNASATAPSGGEAADGSAATGSLASCLDAVFGGSVPDMRGDFPIGQAVSGTASTLASSGGSINQAAYGSLSAAATQASVTPSGWQATVTEGSHTHTPSWSSFTHQTNGGAIIFARASAPSVGANSNAGASYGSNVYSPGALTASGAGAQTPQSAGFTAAAYQAITWFSYTTASYSPAPGSITAYAGSSAPSGWLLANGGCYSTSTYTALFSAIGYTYGGSGGSFCLPDLRGRFALGKAVSGTGSTLGGSGGSLGTSPTLTFSGWTPSVTIPQHTFSWSIPAHTHTIGPWANGQSGQDCNCGNGYLDARGPSARSSAAGGGGTVSSTVSQYLVNGNTIGSASSPVWAGPPPYLALNYVIKY